MHCERVNERIQHLVVCHVKLALEQPQVCVAGSWRSGVCKQEVYATGTVPDAWVIEQGLPEQNVQRWDPKMAGVS